MLNVGDFAHGSTVRIPWNTNAGDGASITRATNGTVKIYKNGGTTERASLAGVTDTEDFDTITGRHLLSIDTSDNTDAGFYAVGATYQVAVDAMTIDGKTVNAWIGTFSLGHPLPGVKYGSVTGTSSTTAIVDSSLTESATDYWKGRIVIFLTGALKGQATKITAFTPSTDTLTVDALTAAPSTGDQYMIV